MDQDFITLDLEARDRIRSGLNDYMASRGIEDTTLYKHMLLYIPAADLGTHKTLQRFFDQAVNKAAEDDPTIRKLVNIPARTNDKSVAAYARFLAIIAAKGTKLTETFASSFTRFYGAQHLGLNGKFVIETPYSRGSFEASPDEDFCEVTEKTNSMNFIYDGVLIRVHTAYVAVLKERSQGLPRSYLLKRARVGLSLLTGHVSTTGYDALQDTFTIEVTEA